MIPDRWLTRRGLGNASPSAIAPTNTAAHGAPAPRVVSAGPGQAPPMAQPIPKMLEPISRRASIRRFTAGAQTSGTPARRWRQV